MSTPPGIEHHLDPSIQPYYSYGAPAPGFHASSYPQPMYGQPPQWVYPNANYQYQPAPPPTPQPQIQFHNTFAPQTPCRTPLASSSQNAPSATSRKRPAPTPATGRARAKQRRVDLEIGLENIDPNLLPSAPPSRVGASVNPLPPSTPTAPSQTSGYVPGTGPFQAPINETTYQHPAFVRYQSILASKPKDTTSASDVWYHTMATTSKIKPSQCVSATPDQLYRKRPKESAETSHLACRLCLYLS